MIVTTDLELLRSEFPGWQFGSVWASAASGPDARRVFERELATAGPATHVRLNIYPDGGVSRLRVLGKIVE